MSAHVDVHPIPDPAFIVLHNVEFADDAEVMIHDDVTDDWVGVSPGDALIAALTRAAGHDNIVVLQTHDDGRVLLLTDPTEAVALVEAAVRQTQEGT